MITALSSTATSTNLGNLFTASSLLSLQGAAAACLIIPNVLGMLIGPIFGPRIRNWTAFSLAQLLAYLTATVVHDGSWLRWIIAFFNGFLIFASAFGVNSIGTHAASQGGRDEAIMSGPSQSERRFFIPWSF
jgi:hypothetical protein